MNFCRLFSLASAVFIFLTSCQRDSEDDNLPDRDVDISLDCSSISINGLYKKDTTLNASNNYLDVSITVNTPGNFLVFTDTVNGIYFRAAGNLSSAGTQVLKLFGNGTPLNAGAYTFRLQGINSNCTFNVNCIEVETEDSSTVYFGSMDGYFYAIGGINGRLKWRHHTNPVLSTPAVIDTFVYVGSNDRNLYAFGMVRGQLKWKFYTGDWPSGDAISSAITTDGGFVYFSCQNGRTYSIDTSTYLNINNIRVPTLKWSYRSGDGSTGSPSAPTVSGGTVFFGFDTTFYALDQHLGTLKWKVWPGDGCENANPCIFNGSVYLARDDNSIKVYNTQTGDIRWSYFSNSMGSHQSSPVISDNILYTTSDTLGFVWNQVKAFNASTGAFLWKTTQISGGSTSTSSPAVANGYVICGSEDGALYAWDNSNGTFKWKYQTAGAIYTSPVIMNNLVYAGSMDGALYAINLTTGALKWKYQTGSSLILSSPIVVTKDKRVYYPSDSGKN